MCVIYFKEGCHHDRKFAIYRVKWLKIFHSNVWRGVFQSRFFITFHKYKFENCLFIRNRETSVLPRFIELFHSDHSFVRFQYIKVVQMWQQNRLKVPIHCDESFLRLFGLVKKIMQLFQNCLVTLLDSSSCCCFVTEARSYLRIFLLSSFVSGYSGNRTSDFVNQHVSPWSPSVRHLVIILRTYAAPGNPLDLAIYLLLYTRNVTTMFRVPFELVLIAYGRLT